MRPVFLGLAAIALLLPGYLRQPHLWIALTVLAALRVLLNWPMADNHAYLLCYWCLAVALAFISHNPQACLAVNGRLLIGLAFVCATLWKVVLSPDYLDGRFFRVILITDLRFEPLALLAGGLTPELLESLRQFVTQHVDGQLVEASDVPQEPACFLWLASIMTWWTVLLEGVIAVAFLWPVECRITKWRDALLLLFCATTYVVAPVEGFGWLLLAMGVAQCGTERRKTCRAYLVVFGLILLYREAPWAQFFSVGQAAR
jgi:hypothetical protein